MSELSNNEKSGDFTDVVDLTGKNLKDIVSGIQPFNGSDLVAAGIMPIADLSAWEGVELVAVAVQGNWSGTSTTVIDIGVSNDPVVPTDPDELTDNLNVSLLANPDFNSGTEFALNTVVTNSLAGAGAIYLKVTDANIADLDDEAKLYIGIRKVSINRFF